MLKSNKVARKNTGECKFHMSGSMKATTKFVVLLEGQSYPRKQEACGIVISVVVDGEPRAAWSAVVLTSTAQNPN